MAEIELVGTRNDKKINEHIQYNTNVTSLL